MFCFEFKCIGSSVISSDNLSLITFSRPKNENGVRRSTTYGYGMFECLVRDKPLAWCQVTNSLTCNMPKSCSSLFHGTEIVEVKCEHLVVNVKCQSQVFI